FLARKLLSFRSGTSGRVPADQRPGGPTRAGNPRGESRGVARISRCSGRGQGGRDVACRWRIRHKVIIGLGLVVGIMAALLFGTLYGLALYRATTKSIDSKLAELKAAGELAFALDDLPNLDSQTTPDVQLTLLVAKSDNAKQKLKAYREKL